MQSPFKAFKCDLRRKTSKQGLGLLLVTSSPSSIPSSSLQVPSGSKDVFAISLMDSCAGFSFAWEVFACGVALAPLASKPFFSAKEAAAASATYLAVAFAICCRSYFTQLKPNSTHTSCNNSTAYFLTSFSTLLHGRVFKSKSIGIFSLSLSVTLSWLSSSV